jgi:hypothetical protein
MCTNVLLSSMYTPTLQKFPKKPNSYAYFFFPPSEFHDQAIITSLTHVRWNGYYCRRSSYCNFVQSPFTLQRWIIFSALCSFFFCGATDQRVPRPPHCWSLEISLSLSLSLTHTHTLSLVQRTPQNEWSVRRRGRYLHTINTRGEHPCPQRDSNPRPQQSSGLRPTHFTRDHRDRLFFKYVHLYLM